MEKLQTIIFIISIVGLVGWTAAGVDTSMQKTIGEKKPTRNDLAEESTTPGTNDTVLSSDENLDNMTSITITPIGSYGYQCITNCSKIGHHGKEFSYFFCYSEDYWDYCSPKLHHDYRGIECKESCAIREGTQYKWCHTVDDAWGYCNA